MTTKHNGTTNGDLQSKGKNEDQKINGDLGNFSTPVAKADYDHAVRLIEEKLDRITRMKARFSLNLGPNVPELIIDARSPEKAFIAAADDTKATDTNLDARVWTDPVMIKRFADGLMDARYAQSWGQIHVEGNTHIGYKFVEAIGPVNVTHPKLDPSKLDRLPKPTEDIQQIKRDVVEFGYGFLKNALTPTEVSKLKKRLMDQAKGEADAGVGFFDGGEGNPNQRIWCLPNKGQEFIDLLDSNKAIDDFIPDFLGDGALLFSYTANIARTGNSPMVLHTDQINVQPQIRQVAFGLNLMYFLDDVTPDRGGTLVMPGSHIGDVAPDDPSDPVDTVPASGPAGTCMVFESRLWHGTGANIVPGHERPVLIVFFIRSWVRPQENFLLSVKPEVVDKCSDKVKGFLGWRSTATIGSVQGISPDGAIVKIPEKDEYIGVLGGETTSLR